MDATPVAFLVAFGIGALIGLEREHGDVRQYAASRTFPLISLTGAGIAAYFPALLPWGLASTAALATAGYWAKYKVTERVGGTTAVAAILTFVLGAMAVHSVEARVYAVVIGAVAAVLLAIKEPLHQFAKAASRDERYAMAKFVVVALIVLPLLPDQEMDVLLGLNPRFVWYMVVLIAAIDLAGYAVARYWGKKGVGAMGFLGGLVSSTATTVAMARRARAAPDMRTVAAFSAVVASLISFPRVLVEVAVVNPDMVASAAVPVVAMMAAGVIASAAFIWRARHQELPPADVRNPFRLGPALVFGALFAIILLASELLQARYGGVGIYATAVVSGFADVDAPTLSFAALAAAGGIQERVAVRGIVFALISNLVVKVGIAGVMGGRSFMIPVALASGAAALAGLMALFLV